MTSRGAQVTPIRGMTQKPHSVEDADKPILQPKTNAVNTPLVLVFGGIIALAGGALLYTTFAPTPNSGPQKIEPLRGGRITGNNTRMVTGVNLGQGRITATLSDETPLETLSAQVATSPSDAALQNRISELEAALIEASKDTPELGKMIEDIAASTKRVAELEIKLDMLERDFTDEKSEIIKSHTDQLKALRDSHASELNALNDTHNQELAEAEGRLQLMQEEAAARIAHLTDERAAASRNARVKSPSVIVNRAASSDNQRYGTSSVPTNPSVSLARGASFRVRLLENVNVALPGAIVAMVESDVRSASGSNIVIPAGTKLRGQYNTEVTQNDTRVIVEWQNLSFNNGATQTLTTGRRGETLLVTTLWPSIPSSLNQDAQITVLATDEISFEN